MKLLGLASLGTLLFAACTFGIEPQASPTPSPSPVPSASPASACPVAGPACSFAANLSFWLLTGNLDPLVGRTSFTAFTCPGPHATTPSDPFPLCDGADAGEQRLGFSIELFGPNNEVVSPEGYRQLLRDYVQAGSKGASDQYGSLEARGVAIACPIPTGGCDEKFAVAFSGGKPSSPRTELIFFITAPASQPVFAFAGLLMGSIVPPGLDILFNGGELPVAVPSGFPPFGAFHPWSPQ